MNEPMPKRPTVGVEVEEPDEDPASAGLRAAVSQARATVDEAVKEAQRAVRVDIRQSAVEVVDALDQPEERLQEYAGSGWDEFKAEVARYVLALHREAARIKRRQRAPAVSAEYVREAALSVASSTPTKLGKIANAAGGVLLGGAVGNVMAVSLSSAPAWTVTGMLVTLGAGIVGASLMIWQIARE